MQILYTTCLALYTICVVLYTFIIYNNFVRATRELNKTTNDDECLVNVKLYDCLRCIEVLVHNMKLINITFVDPLHTAVILVANMFNFCLLHC